MLKMVLAPLLLAALVPLAAAPTAPQLDLMPMPQSVQAGTGELLITQSFSVSLSGAKDERLQRAVNRFLADLSRQTGMPLTPAQGSAATLVVTEQRPSKQFPQLGEDESYDLEVTAAGAKINAPTTLGAMHGLETFLQLVAPGPGGFAAPVVVIHDRPRFAWRGLLVDVSRHFIPLSELRRTLDGLAAVKMNVLHLHLSDDQGFRVESKKFPKLQQMGSGGNYYTQDEIRDLLAYAADRGIRIVPEFDMPGHSISWLVGYPELASGPGPYHVEPTWGIHDPAMDPTRDSTYKFLDSFIGEMAKLFPDQYFHIGGDEVNGKQWDANPQIRQFMSTHGMKNNADLQAYFNQHVEKIVSKHGKTMEGWDEILRPDLPKSIVIQSWRGPDSLAQAARQGYRGLLSSGFYIDLMQPAAQHYAVDPMSGQAASLNADEKQRILGGEACLWTEYVSPENFDSRVWPRTAAIAERLWSAQDVRDVPSMYRRLEATSDWLDELGFHHRSSYYVMLHRLAGNYDMRPLQVLGDVVEPVKEYTREDLAAAPPTSTSPLNRLVDAVHPESDTARQFADMVNDVVGGRATPVMYTQMRAALTAWRENNARLEPLLQQSFLLKEVVPISQNLSTAAAAGLQALDYLRAGQPAPRDWATQQLSSLQQAAKPDRSQLLLMVVPAIQKLVESSAGMASPNPAAAPSQSAR